jgi:hypothetical protein
MVFVVQSSRNSLSPTICGGALEKSDGALDFAELVQERGHAGRAPPTLVSASPPSWCSPASSPAAAASS